MTTRGAGLVLLALVAGACDGSRPRDVGPPEVEGAGRIAFARGVHGDFDLYVMAADGGDARRLTRTPERAGANGDDRSPTWSPDGSMIAFVSNRDHGPGGWHTDEIYVMQTDGSRQRRLTANRYPDEDPHWTADGRIAFTACELSGIGEPVSCRLQAVAADGGRPETLADDLGVVLGARLSPDETELVLVRMDGQSHYQHLELYVRKVDGGAERRLTDNEAGEANPDWSPDGERIAFVSNRAPSASCLFHDCTGWTNEIYVMDADGSGVERLTETPEDEGHLEWSPDGSQILFGRIRDEQDDYDLHVIEADGSCERQLTETAAWEWTPAWHGGASARLDC